MKLFKFVEAFIGNTVFNLGERFYKERYKLIVLYFAIAKKIHKLFKLLDAFLLALFTIPLYHKLNIVVELPVRMST